MRKYASLSAEYLSTLADKFDTMMKCGQIDNILIELHKNH
jgi:hypothetical protein